MSPVPNGKYPAPTEKLPTGTRWPSPILNVSQDFDQDIKSGRVEGYRPIPSGFPMLDQYLGGGFTPESLIVLGGPPGVGKTVFALQAARNIAYTRPDALAMVVCFEHSEVYLYHRLLCLESVMGGNTFDEQHTGLTIDGIRKSAILRDTRGEPGLAALITNQPGIADTWVRMSDYWERLLLSKGHPTQSSLRVLDLYIQYARSHYNKDSVVLFVDYLQKVPVSNLGPNVTREQQVRIVTEGLKNIALHHCIPIVAIAAGDEEGLKGDRLRFEDLWGGEGIKYEPDVAIMLNPVFQTTPDGHKGRVRTPHVLFSIEKNRLGPTGVEFAYSLHGANFAFDTFAPARDIATLVL